MPEEFVEQAKRGLASAALALLADMVDIVGRSGSEPSAPGEPPHVQTGLLQLSMDTKRLDQGMRWLIGPRAPHAHLLEFGTVKARPRPFARPAFDRMKSRITAMVARGK